MILAVAHTLSINCDEMAAAIDEKNLRTETAIGFPASPEH